MVFLYQLNKQGCHCDGGTTEAISGLPRRLRLLAMTDNAQCCFGIASLFIELIRIFHDQVIREGILYCILKTSKFACLSVQYQDIKQNCLI